MSENKDNVNKLKGLRKKLEYLKKKNDSKEKNDIIDFYEDGLKLKNVANGMVVIITRDYVVNQKSIGKISHERVAQEIFNNLPVNRIDFSKIDGDFGHVISTEYDSIFIRMASVLNGPTIVYYPDVCSDFQINKLEEFNNYVKEFNSSKKELYRVKFEYNGRSDEDKNDLDELIMELKRNLKNNNAITK